MFEFILDKMMNFHTRIFSINFFSAKVKGSIVRRFVKANQVWEN